MNERIDEIAKEARDYAGGYWDEYSHAWFQFYNEKFAELIVRECRLAVNRIEVESPEASIALTMADAAIRDCFGVE